MTVQTAVLLVGWFRSGPDPVEAVAVTHVQPVGYHHRARWALSAADVVAGSRPTLPVVQFDTADCRSLPHTLHQRSALAYTPRSRQMGFLGIHPLNCSTGLVVWHIQPIAQCSAPLDGQDECHA